eukprot:1016025-Rhodomonas_salina.1
MSGTDVGYAATPGPNSPTRTTSTTILSPTAGGHSKGAFDNGGLQREGARLLRAAVLCCYGY